MRVRRWHVAVHGVVLLRCMSRVAPCVRGETRRYALLPADVDAVLDRTRVSSCLVESVADGRFAGDKTATGQVRVERSGGRRQWTTRASCGRSATARRRSPRRSTARSATATIAVDGMDDDAGRSFRNDVQPVLAKMGCSTGACHGALAGKGGFKLSLRGYDAMADYLAITRDARGRRIEPTDPGRSLLLAQADDGRAAQRRACGSTSIRRRTRSFRSGLRPARAPPRDDDPIDRRARSVSGRSHAAAAAISSGSSCAPSTSDGRMRDVTQWAKFAATNEAVATVDEDGRIKVVGHGGGAVTVWYSSKIVNVRITSPYDARGAGRRLRRGDAAEFHRRAGAQAACSCCICRRRRRPMTPRSSAARFSTRSANCRRPTKSRAFLADQSPDKRDRLIEALLAREEFVDYWAYQWSDLLLVNGTRLRPEAVKAFYHVDSRAREREHAVGRIRPADRAGPRQQLENGATNFYALHQDPETMTENVSQAFLGLSIGCAKCHNHPLEKWTNDQYYAMANLFARVQAKGLGRRAAQRRRRADAVRRQPRRFGSAVEGRAAAAGAARRASRWPADQRATAASIWPSGSPRRRTRTSRGRSPTACGRTFFGVGLVEPVDDLRLSNPASNEELLAAAAKYLVEHNYDLKALMRVILQSAAYQRSSEPAEAQPRRHAEFTPSTTRGG